MFVYIHEIKMGKDHITGRKKITVLSDKRFTKDQVFRETWKAQMVFLHLSPG